VKIYSSEISGSLKVRGDIFAENYVVKSTVSTITQSFSSGSTIFGDTPDDTHQFSGSLKIGGSSFFREIGSGHQVYIDSDVGGVSQIGTNTYTPLSIRANGNQAIYISQGAQVTINNLIGTAAEMGTLTSTGNIVSTGANALISGSSTSTGSFGTLQIPGKFIIDSTSKISLSNNDGGNTSNTIFGKSAFNASSDVGADYNSFFGEGVAGTGTLSTATGNVGIGWVALQDLTAGSDNIAIGQAAGHEITTGNNNVIVGAMAVEQ